MLARAPLRWSRGQWPRYQLALIQSTCGRTLSQKCLGPFDHELCYRSPISDGLQVPHLRLRTRQSRLTNRRTLMSQTVQTILTPPLVFVGLLLTLWTYKCIMMVLFQDKIIYMPGMPPFSRSEKIEDYVKECKPVEWEEKHIKSLDGTKITLCIGQIPHAIGDLSSEAVITPESKNKEVVICYFQGNGSSLPPRLPILSNVLKILHAKISGSQDNIRYTLIGLSYRGYWTSSGRASQSGIELDAQALLRYVATTSSNPHRDVEVVLWGQSIGSGVATTAAAQYLAHEGSNQLTIAGLVLETPFTGINGMLIALYPQKWLPYRYLGPFLWNHWDSQTALSQMSVLRKKPRVLLLPATRDEVVPAEEANKLERLCKDMGFYYERKDVMGALHNEATTRRDGQQSVARFIADITTQTK